MSRRGRCDSARGRLPWSGHTPDRPALRRALGARADAEAQKANAAKLVKGAELCRAPSMRNAAGAGAPTAAPAPATVQRPLSCPWEDGSHPATETTAMLATANWLVDGAYGSLAYTTTWYVPDCAGANVYVRVCM